MSLARWLSPCAFGHGDLVRSRDAEGALILSCLRCHAKVSAVLAGGIEHAQPLAQVVAGAPTIKATRVTRSNVAPWKVSQK